MNGANRFFQFQNTHCFPDHRAGLSILPFFLNIPDQIRKKLFAFSAAFARAGRVHNLLYGVRSISNGILNHAIGDIFTMTGFFSAIQNTVPPQFFRFINRQPPHFRQGRRMPHFPENRRAFSWAMPTRPDLGGFCIILSHRRKECKNSRKGAGLCKLSCEHPAFPGQKIRSNSGNSSCFVL